VKAAIFKGPGAIEVGERPDPVICEPTDAVVRVVLGCVCGSDLWYYRGESPHAVGSIGHEFIGVVEQAGAEAQGIRLGDLVVAPFIYSDMSCPHCLNGSTISCPAGGNFGDGQIDGGQGEAVRVPLAGSTLVPVPGSGHSDQTLRSLLALSDVMPTGHHAAVSAGVKKGDVVAVVGDGAVGLCAVLASKRLGAERIIALSRRPERQQMAREFGATDIVETRGEEASQAVLDLTADVGADAALECVGTAESIATAFAVARPGSTFPTCSVMSLTASSTPAGFSTTRRALITSPTPTGPWMSDGPSSHSSGLERRERLDRGGVAAHRRCRGVAACLAPPGWVAAAVHHNVGRPGRDSPVRPFRGRAGSAVVPPRTRQPGRPCRSRRRRRRCHFRGRGT
jgi:threonine dehydrogenase-like Zn-dependent dehydrogenase